MRQQVQVHGYDLKKIDMIVYFAGDGQKQEDDEHLLELNDHDSWGVLLSYKTIKTKRNNKGSTRFQRLMKRIKNETTSGVRTKRRRKTSDKKDEK